MGGLTISAFCVLYISLAIAMISTGRKYGDPSFCSFKAPLYVQLNGWLLIAPGVACVFGIPICIYVTFTGHIRRIDSSNGFFEFLVAFFLGWLIELTAIGRTISPYLRMYEEIITTNRSQHYIKGSKFLKTRLFLTSFPFWSICELR